MKKLRNSNRENKEKISLRSNYLVLTAKHMPWILLYSLLLLSVWVFFFSGLLDIQNISCIRDETSCSKQVNSELSKYQDESMLLFKAKEVQAKLKNADPTIASIKIITRLPGTLQVVITTKNPEFSISTENSAKSLLVDKSGFIISQENSQEVDLPVIVISEPLQLNLGEKINDNALYQALELAILLRDYFIPFKNLSINNGRLTGILSDGTTVIFSNKREFAKQVTSLQQILSQATMESKPKTIDLRFDKPVISFE